MAYLNTLFAFMIEIVNQHGGIIHQLLGDGFMALFGAPISGGNDSRNAIQAALAIVARVQAESGQNHIPPTRIGIGVHVGAAVVGTVGSAIHQEYKVTGDVVNLAARIEQLNKTYDSQLLVTEAAWQAAQMPMTPVIEKDAVEVRGRTRPVKIYQLA